MAENTMIDASEARRLTEAADPNREYAEADTLAQSALSWALRNAEGRTDTRVRTYAQHGHTRLSLKFAPGSGDGRGNGNSFYNDLLGNSNVAVAGWATRSPPAASNTATPTSMTAPSS